MRASAREGNKHAREQFFLTICGGGDLTICILLPAPPPSATRTKISCSRAYSYPLGRLPFLTVIKRDSYISSAAVCNIPAPIRPSAVRNSNKNLLLSGALCPFLTERCVAGAREGRVFFCRKRCLYCQNRGISYRFGVERQYDDYLCACRHRVGQGGERERSFLRHGDSHSVCGHE